MLFDGKLGTWKDVQVYLKLKDGAEPYHGRAFPVPKAYEQQLREEVDRLVKIGVLRRVNRSLWGVPSFPQKKPNGSIRFLSDFREVNKRIKRFPYPLPKIQELLTSLEGFTFATSLDLNMGYYHILLTPNASSICTIVLPWGKYEYLKLPQGLCSSPDIF